MAHKRLIAFTYVESCASYFQLFASSFAGELQLHLHHFVAESLKTFDKVTAKYQMCYLWKHDVFFSRLGASNSV